MKINSTSVLEDKMSDCNTCICITEEITIKEEPEVNINYTKNEEIKEECIKYDNEAQLVHKQNQLEDMLTFTSMLTFKAVDSQHDSLVVNSNIINNINCEYTFTKNINEEICAERPEQKYHHLEDNKNNIDILENKILCSEYKANDSFTSNYEENNKSSSIGNQTASTSETNIDYVSDQKKDCSELEYKQITKRNIWDYYNLFKSSNNTHIVPKIYECFICCKTFSRKYDMKLHIRRVHQQIRSYECHDCNKLFASKGCVQKHIGGVHQKIKSYACKECPKKFFLAAMLRRHVSAVHKKIKNYECHECCTRFFTVEKLQRHIYGVHRKIRNYKCHECCRMFSNKQCLQIHINAKHQNIRNFKCMECVKVFKYNADYIKHINTIHKGKKYNCIFCKKIFSYKSGLTTHIKAVHKEIKHQCSKCSKVFLYVSSLRKHVRSVHK